MQPTKGEFRGLPGVLEAPKILEEEQQTILDWQ